MTPLKTALVLLPGIAAVSFLLACTAQKPTQAVGMANPAAIHCLNQGGKLEMVNTTAGATGMCHLPDGTVIEEWALFRRDKAQLTVN